MKLAEQARKSAFWAGYFDMLPFLLIVMPFGMLFGAVASEAGLDIIAVMAFSVLIIAGAAQFTAITLMSENAPTVIILLTSLAVNLRMAMYSAAMVPHLGHLTLRKRLLASYFMIDQTFAMSISTFESQPEMSKRDKAAYFFGCATFLAPLWYLFTFLGAIIGVNIPDGLALDFAIPICFISLAAPMIRSLPHLVAAVCSVVLSLVFVAVPYSLGLIIAASLAMVAGAQTEVWLERRGNK